ncbi:hypothetical protein [Saccharothrix syringae]|uniref:hypothetical protein n=1 Tax=Saccharothrix syringae TaxID=103733 RepID=UPI000525D935|nr:hypothetical protein [Saccharothrix syringae]
MLLTGMVVVSVGTANACTCPSQDTEAKRYARVDHVFTGVVLAEVPDMGDPNVSGDDKYLYMIRVGTEYKGDVPVGVVTVETPVHSTVCGTRLGVGYDYLLFVFRLGDSFRTYSCNGNRLASGGPPVTGPTATSAGTAVAAGATSPCAAQAV